MMDGRRHSVDIPISKTLVALRRVRSLRDPSTNSMTKLSSLNDNVHWENGSSNGISLRFMDAPRACDFDDNGILRSNDLSFERQLNCGLLNSSCQEGQQEDNELVYIDPKRQGISGKESPSESSCSSHGSKALATSNHFKDGESTAISSQLGRIDYSKSVKKFLFKHQVNPSEVVTGIANHFGSPCVPIRDSLSPNSASISRNQDIDAVLDNDDDDGCEVSCCWSKSPRLRESNRYRQIKDHSLILAQVDQRDVHGHAITSMRDISGDISPNLETPRSLSMKFRPKTFGDLVGQNFVVKSLLGAITRGRITSFYIFHGPRGTGKTSASRIFAAAMNCLSVEAQKPCGLCRECILFFSGRSKSVKEVDSVRINHRNQVKFLVKNACTPPVSSRFKVFIIDECQLLNGETWLTLSNSLENLPQYAVFVMITPDLDKLPQSAVSRAQRYHFPKIKDVDIAGRLEKICAKEGIDFEQAALEFVASKSCGSVRDAEMMLDQLSLLGKKITTSLAYELTGIVSDDDLLDLLDLALSSDTSNTVLRARELMRSRVDPLQLISQLATLIMDILAGKCEAGVSEVRSRFSGRHTSEADLKKLRHALNFFSEAEKQLRISKNQTTWFTVALLQLSSVDHPSGNANDTKLCLRDGDFSSPSTEQSLKHLAKDQCDNKPYRLGMPESHKGTLDSIWYKATELCQPSRLKTFLRKQGKLSSLQHDHSISCLAIAELEFHHRHYVSKAEKSWKLIASSLQFILGCNIELRINYVPYASDSKYATLKRSSFSFFSCSRKLQQKLFSSNEQGSESDCGDYTSQIPMMQDKTQTCSCHCRSRAPTPESYHGMQVVTTLRSREGNLLSSGKRFLSKSCQEVLGVDSSKEQGCDCAPLVPSTIDSDNQSNCFLQNLWL